MAEAKSRYIIAVTSVFSDHFENVKLWQSPKIYNSEDDAKQALYDHISTQYYHVEQVEQQTAKAVTLDDKIEAVCYLGFFSDRKISYAITKIE